MKKDLTKCTKCKAQLSEDAIEKTYSLCDRCAFTKITFVEGPSLPGFAAAVGYSDGKKPEELPWAVFRKTVYSGEGPMEQSVAPIAFLFNEGQAKAIANMMNRESKLLNALSRMPLSVQGDFAAAMKI